MINGIPASGEYASGHAILKKELDLKQHACENLGSAAEKEKFLAAVKTSKRLLKDLSQKAGAGGKKDTAEIIQSQLTFLDDPDIFDATIEKIDGGMCAQEAILCVTNAVAEEFDAFEDGPIKEKAADIRDVGERIAKNIAGVNGEDLSKLPKGTVLVAHELKPSDTAQLDRSKVLAIVTETGGQTCHTAIMARSMGIAAVVGAAGILDKINDGDLAIVDGVKGVVFVNPSEETKQSYRIKIQEAKEKKRLQAAVKNKPCAYPDGRRIGIFANIGSPDDAQFAIENGAEGIGLFRTEFLYIGKDHLPTEEEQFSAYRKTAQIMGDKPVIIRTTDIGGDKDIPFLNIKKEDNPFLGFRAIRLCLKNLPLFTAQLRAVLRASAYGNLKIMFPMISNLDEFRAAKNVLHSCMDALRTEKIPFNENIETGIMVEVPSTAIMAEEFAKEVDFFSIGTNDLTQYTLASDRMNESVSYLYNPMDPAVLRLIHGTIEAAHKNGITCGMCGEMASKPEAVLSLLKFGLDEFSVSAGSIPEIRLSVLNKCKCPAHNGVL